MPGLKESPSPGMADIDVCFGAHRAGSEGVQTALQRARWKYEERQRQSVGTLDSNRYSDIISSPEDEPDIGGSAEYSAPTVPSVQERSADVVPSPPGLDSLDQSTPPEPVSPLEVEGNAEVPADDDTPPSPNTVESKMDAVALPIRSAPLDTFGAEDSRLPPTPPTLHNGDNSEQQGDDTVLPSPPFANSVTNGLSSKHSGQTITPVNQPASPPTPDPSPPRRQHSPPTPHVEMKEISHLLKPPEHYTSDHQLDASSVAESFRTAYENQTLMSNASLSPVRLPENDRLPEHWLDSTRELQSASIGLGDITVKQTPKIGSGAEPKNITTDSGRYESLRNGLGITDGLDKSQSLRQTAEVRNNIVYKRLQEENMKRHSTVSANSGAITVGIAIPSNESTPRTLRRQNKRSSLRLGSSDHSNRGTRQSSEGSRTITSSDPNRDRIANGGRTLKQKKARELEKTNALADSPLFGKSTLDDSPILQSSIRQVSSPARIGPDPSDMTALTYASMQDSPSARQAAKFQTQPQHKLRHVSHEDRLSRNMSVRRTSLEASPPLNNIEFQQKLAKHRAIREASYEANKVKDITVAKRGQTIDTKTPQRECSPPPNVAASEGTTTLERSPGGTLRHFSREERLENNTQVRRTSLDQASQSSPVVEPVARRTSSDRGIVPLSPRKSIDARNLHPTTTPMSVSQFSDRTENIEIGEANGVRFYPHTNDSLLVVQQGSRPVTNDKDASEAPHFFSSTLNPGSYLAKPTFAANVEPPTPTLSVSKPVHHVDSPLTNPRTAPEPPVFMVIPPTPERELDNQLGSWPVTGDDQPQRRLSLMQRARRYSDIVFPNLGSLRKPRNPRYKEERATHLSPLWRPQGFWDEFDSDREEYDDFEPAGSLPRGGDTSNIVESEAQKKGLLPRAMSKRLPGFRGSGGFLQGNSLGIDRHGSNNRRHYVSSGSRTLSKRESEEVMRNLSSSNGRISPEQRVVKQQRFAMPFAGGAKAKRLRAKIKTIRLAKEEREREKRRDEIRKSIGYRVYHEGQAS